MLNWSIIRKKFMRERSRSNARIVTPVLNETQSLEVIYVYLLCSWNKNCVHTYLFLYSYSCFKLSIVIRKVCRNCEILTLRMLFQFQKGFQIMVEYFQLWCRDSSFSYLWRVLSIFIENQVFEERREENKANMNFFNIATISQYFS